MTDAEQINKYLNKDLLYDELPCGFVSFSPDGKILSVNKTMAVWIGITLPEIKEQNFKALLTKASLLYYSLVIDPLLNLKSNVNEINLKFACSQGSFDALLNAVSYKNDQGNLILIHATVQKITDRKKYETQLLLEKRYAEEQKRKFEFLFNSVPIQVWTTDHKGAVLNINQKTKDYFGISHSADLLFFKGILNEGRNKIYNEWKKCLSSGKKFEREIRIQGVKNIPEWFLVFAEPYYNTEGKIETWFCSCTNINKQKLLQIANQEELKLNLSTAYRTLDENEKLFVTIAMNQSHMIRKPLANIMGLVHLLQGENSPAESNTLLTLLAESAAELDDMIKQVSAKTGK